MITKDELDRAIADVVAGVRSRSLLPLPMLLHTQDRFDALLDQCVDLQKELLSITESDPAILDIEKKVYALETAYRRLRARLQFLPSVLLLYSGGFLAFWLVRFVDIPKFITATLGVEAPEKLISFGIAGAFLYLATSLLSKIESASAGRSQFAGVANFTLRLLLAVVVPIVLVGLFFAKDGTVRQVKVSPEILSFACGYSAKLVMDLLNKIVEKARKMVEAI